MSETSTPTVFQDSSIFPFLKQRWPLLLMVVFVLGFLGASFYFSFYDKGYAPVQPIAYSHKLHAGDLGIDCRYCHFNAERGKHAGVPPTSVCLGCHATDKGGVNGDQPEIQKLLAMAATDDGTWTDPATGVVHEGGAIHWNRVHKLPDFVYFSHQWHVQAGVACQTCHGPVEEMVVVRQHADLSMGWCIKCHRNDQYVGGPAYDGKDPATFTVGTADYDVVRARIKPDVVVEFVERHTKGAHPDHPGEEHHETAFERPFGDAGAPTPKQIEAINQVLQRFPHLKDAPSWRIIDLPETHRAVYRDLIAHKAGAKSIDDVTPEDQRRWLMQLSFNNSPTQCSTCHQ